MRDELRVIDTPTGIAGVIGHVTFIDRALPTVQPVNVALALASTPWLRQILREADVSFQRVAAPDLDRGNHPRHLPVR